MDKNFDEMDKLEKIFFMQKMLNSDIAKKRKLAANEDEKSVDEWLQKYILATISELGELLDEVNFKWWKNEKKLDINNIKEEIIDIMHFFVSMCLLVGMDAQEVLDVYMKKNKENFDRQIGLSSKTGYKFDQN